MASRAVFLDTNGLLALLNRADALHPSARRVWDQILQDRRQVVVTDWVVAETGNGMARTNGRLEAAAFLLGLVNSVLCEVVFVSEGLLDESLARYRSRPDKTWGLVDCCSMLVMERLSILEASTSDHHFEQAGFARLL